MLIQVAVAMLALLALSAFVFDYGVMWASRGQAQNAADAGALAGAHRRSRSTAGRDAARRAATALATAAIGLGQDPDRHGRCHRDGAAARPAPGNTPTGCVKVDVSQSGATVIRCRRSSPASRTSRIRASAPPRPRWWCREFRRCLQALGRCGSLDRTTPTPARIRAGRLSATTCSNLARTSTAPPGSRADGLGNDAACSSRSKARRE